jgi:hypothetical protein
MYTHGQRARVGGLKERWCVSALLPWPDPTCSLQHKQPLPPHPPFSPLPSLLARVGGPEEWRPHSNASHSRTPMRHCPLHPPGLPPLVLPLTIELWRHRSPRTFPPPPLLTTTSHSCHYLQPLFRTPRLCHFLQPSSPSPSVSLFSTPPLFLLLFQVHSRQGPGHQHPAGTRAHTGVSERCTVANRPPTKQL